MSTFVRAKNTLIISTLLGSLSLFTVGCGKQENRDPVLDLGIFEPIVKRFEQVSSTQGSEVHINDLRITFGAMDSPRQRALCDLTSDEPPTIIVLQNGWNAMNDTERESLLFHELGHCVLARTHKPEVAPNGLPTSLMNPYLLSGYVYMTYQNHYWQELFDPTQRQTFR